ncbi:hypothetical protein Aduo_015764 [Ancylostoma duodenale]
MSNMAERLQHQEIVLDMEVQDDRETALMLLEDLRLYPDIEVSAELNEFCANLLLKYEYRKLLFCNACNDHIPHRLSLCTNELCPLPYINPKRAKNLRRSSVHSLKVRPQLDAILKNTLELLIDVHRRIHSGRTKRVKENTSDFPQYKGDIENAGEFANNEIDVVLTINFDGVKLKKLLRYDAYPVYLRLEGLPFEHKSRPENNILAAVLFSSKVPTERLLNETFCRLARELEELKTSGIVVSNPVVGVWNCVPILKNAVIDFEALKNLFRSPRWLSKHGCHLCTFPGERVAHNNIWFVSFPSTRQRRTHTSILDDADAHRNGLRGG